MDEVVLFQAFSLGGWFLVVAYILIALSVFLWGTHDYTKTVWAIVCILWLPILVVGVIAGAALAIWYYIIYPLCHHGQRLRLTDEEDPDDIIAGKE